MDPRLYDIVAALATNQPAAATSTFKEILGDRVDQRVAQYARDYQYEVRKDVQPDA